MKIGSLLFGIIIGALAMFGGYNFLIEKIENKSTKQISSNEEKPLYWVAPMDANYKRDKPGKSPMGMDLIPFYANNSGGPDEGVGTIKISPAVENNLGVRTNLVEKKSLQSTINTVGYVNYDEDHLVHVHPRVQGWIEKLYVKASGDPVKKGQALYAIYSPEMVNAQEELLLALDRKKTRLIKAAKNRLESLQVPSSTIKQLEKTRKVSQTVTFYSPKSGVIDNLQIREGFFAKPGTTLMSIGTLKQVWVNAEVFERQASQIYVGSQVSMTLDYLPGYEWKGKVDYIYPTLDSKTRTIKVRLKFENKNELLKPGMFAQVKIQGKRSKETLVIPREAVIRTGNSSRVVLALGEGKFKSVNVKVGQYNEEYAQILYGLTQGEKVVTSAQFLLDSESSKTSDFKRMSHIDKRPEQNMQSMATMESKEKNNAQPKEWAKATVVKLMPDDNAIKVTHSAIPGWKWPAMTMNFGIDKNLDYSQFKKDMSMDIEITKTKNNKYIITDVKMSKKHLKTEK